VSLIVSLIQIGGCAASRRNSKSELGALDTVSFILKTNVAMMQKLETPDSVHVFFENVFYNNLSLTLRYHENSFKKLDSSVYNILQKRKEYYAFLREIEEKVPLPKQTYVKTVRRIDFIKYASSLSYEPIYLVMSLPYYVRENHWFVEISYMDQYCHGDSFGVLVNFINGEVKIVWIFDAGSS
jgi:hypothetical protein